MSTTSNSSKRRSMKPNAAASPASESTARTLLIAVYFTGPTIQILRFNPYTTVSTVKHKTNRSNAV